MGFLPIQNLPEVGSEASTSVGMKQPTDQGDSSVENLPISNTTYQELNPSNTLLKPGIMASSQVSSVEGDFIHFVTDSGFSDPTLMDNSSQAEESDQIQINDAPIGDGSGYTLGDDSSGLMVPEITPPIAGLPISPVSLPVVTDHVTTTDIVGPQPEPPVLEPVDPITGTPFDELIEQLLQALNPVAIAPSQQASNATASIADLVPPPPMAAASAIATTPATTTTSTTRETATGTVTPPGTTTCEGLSSLDELTLRLHDGFELRSGQAGQSTAQFLTNYGRDTDDRTFIRVTDRRDPFTSNDTVYFEGEVQFGETFTVRADADGFHSKIYLHYFDEANHNILRTVQYSASCGAPAQVNDELGGATLVAFR